MSRRNSTTGFKKLLKDDSSWWEITVTGIAELIGSAILVFIGCMGCVGALGGPPALLQVALTFGFAIASIVQIIGHISHSNITPVVTICLVILGRKSLISAGVYIAAQFVGAFVGYGLITVVTPENLLYTSNATVTGSFCVTTVNEKIGSMQGAIIEAVATAILIFFVCACVDPRNAKNSDSTAVKFGLIITALALAIGHQTGCSLNPARSFAPALWNNVWKDQWVYWVGPISGSILASFIYRGIFWPKESSDEQNIPESVPLNSIDTEKP